MSLTRSFSLSILLLSFTLLAPPAVAQNGSAGTLSTFPSIILECDGDQCTRGGGGSIWLFQGMHGQAMWHYGAVAELTIERFDGRTVVIRRVDPAGSYSSRFAPRGQLFTAEYTGAIHGNRIDGTVSFGGAWYATIPGKPCSPFAECPLDANQVFQLGQNAFTGKEYAGALFCFLVAAREGNPTARSFAGLMFRDGIGVPRNYNTAFILLQQSAEQDDYDGELGLARMYELGVGPIGQRDPERATFWKNRATKRAAEIKAQQSRDAQAQASWNMGAVLLGGAAVLGAIAITSSGNEDSHNAGNGSGWNPMSYLAQQMAQEVMKQAAKRVVEGAFAPAQTSNK